MSEYDDSDDQHEIDGGAKLRVLVYTPGVPLGEALIMANNLSAMQAIVGGNIETVSGLEPKHLCVVCNGNGRLVGLPMNRANVPGRFFVTRDGRDGEFATLSDLDVKHIRQQLDGPATKDMIEDAAAGDRCPPGILADTDPALVCYGCRDDYRTPNEEFCRDCLDMMGALRKR